MIKDKHNCFSTCCLFLWYFQLQILCWYSFLHTTQGLIDGILHAFQKQTDDDANVMLNVFGTMVNVMG